jgi:hypothetical protein
MPHTDPSAFIGYWKITYMETWAQHYVDLVVPGFIEFTDEDEHVMGTFQFGTVSGGRARTMTAMTHDGSEVRTRGDRSKAAADIFTLSRKDRTEAAFRRRVARSPPSVALVSGIPV